jgi:hypothetical protein
MKATRIIVVVLALLVVMTREGAAMFVNHSAKEIVLHIAFVGDAPSAESWTRSIWEKTPPENRGKVIDLKDGEAVRRSFTFLPKGLGEIRGLSVRVALDAVYGKGVTEGDLDDLLRAADAVVVVSDRKRVDAALTRLARSATPVIVTDQSADAFSSLKGALGVALSSLKSGGSTASYAKGQADELRAYLAASFVRSAVSKVLQGEREDFDVMDNGRLTTAQVMSFPSPRGHTLITSGFSARSMGGCRYELMQQVTGDPLRSVETLAGLAKHLERGRAPCRAGVVRTSDGTFLLGESDLGETVWFPTDVSRVVHPQTGVDGFFFRGRPFCLAWDLAQGETGDRVRFFEVLSMTAADAAEAERAPAEVFRRLKTRR